MKKIFVDDKRNLDEAIKSGYICVQSYKNCIMLLSIYKKVEIINLDYDLGGQETG